MLASTFAQLRGAAAYRKVIALLLAGCVASFVLGQAAGHSPHVSRAAVTSPAQTEAVIAGALGTPAVAPPRIIVPLSSTTRAPQADHDSEHHGKDGGPHVMPSPDHHHGHHHGGQPMPPVRADSQQDA